MSEINVRELTPNELATWDRLVATSPQGSVFLYSNYLQMLCTTDPSMHITYLGCFDSDGMLKAGQAVIYRRFLGMFIGFDNWFYCGPVLEPVLDKPRWYKANIEHGYLTALAVEMNKRFPNVVVEIHPTLTDMRPFIWLGWKISLHYTHIYDLTESREINKKMSRGERQMINRGNRNFSFKKETWKEAGQDFIKLHQKSMKKQSWQPSDDWNRVFNKRIQWMEDSGLCMLTTARNADNELGGAFLIILSNDHKTAYFWRLAYDLSLADTGIVPALIHHGIEFLPNEITRVDSAEGMTRQQSCFKDFVGTDLQPYFVVVSDRRLGNRLIVKPFKKMLNLLRRNLSLLRPIFH